MGWLILFVLPALFFLLLDLLVFGKPPPWLRMPAVVHRAWRRVHRPPPVHFDPFDALHVQHRLGSLTEEIQRLEDDRLVFARAHRIKVAQSAYDAVLGEACRLAGVQPQEDGRPGPTERAREELELASRGWFW